MSCHRRVTHPATTCNRGVTRRGRAADFNPLDGSKGTKVHGQGVFIVGTSTRKERDATATGTVTFDGNALVDGAANHFITPFIRTDEERYTQPGN